MRRWRIGEKYRKRNDIWEEISRHIERKGGFVMEDQQIIALYWSRDPQAIEHSSRKYGAYLFTVAHRILSSREDCEECVNDTWLRAWNGMPPQRPDILRMFFAKITRNLAFDVFKSHHAEKRGGGQVDLALEELAECIPHETDVEDQLLAEALGETVRQFVAALPPREADVFARRYFFAEPVKDIAQSYGLRPNHVSVLLRRTREKLKEYLLEEGWLDEPTGSL